MFVPLRGRTHTDDEMPQIPRGPALLPREPDGGSDAAVGPDDTSPAGASPAESDPPEESLAETSPADMTPANARSAHVRPADNSPAEAGQADANHGDAQPSEKDQDPPEKDQDKAGPRPGSAGPPPRVPARQGPPPKPAPGNTSAAPAPRPGGAPATRPGSVPAARPGAAPAPRQAAGPPARLPAAPPSWAAVLTTTFRLWARRRMQKTRWRALAGLAAAVLLFAAGALTATLIEGTPAGNSSGTSQGGGSTAQGGTPGGVGGALAYVTTARKQAANWVAEQVNPDETIGCDPMMCTALQAANIQANRLIMLGPSQPDPLGSEILLDTATLRAQFGPRLEAVYAPVSLAAFGSGAARVEVRFVTPNSAHAYRAEVARDVAARKAAGTEMLRNHSIHASPLARRQLIAGQVDTRLLVTLVTLAHSYPVEIISFGTNQAGASRGVPLRSAEIAGAPGPGSSPAASVQTLRSFINAQQPPYRPSAIVAVRTATRRTVLRVEYPAPSLLGLLGTHGETRRKSR